MDFSAFLAPFDEGAPSGTDLRNDPRFDAIQRALEPASREARTDEDGTINVAPQVDWASLVEQATELAQTGRDLRLLVMATRMAANIDGFQGLADGLTAMTEALDGFWDSIHPELRDRPDPAEACLRRRNALMQLENDDNGLLGDLEMNAVLSPRGIGPISGDDLAKGLMSENDYVRTLASGLGDGEIAAAKARHADRVNRVKAGSRALAAEEPERAAAIAAAIAAAEAARAGLEAKFTEKAGLEPGMGLRLAELKTFLDRVGKAVAAALAEVGSAATAEAPAAETAQAAPGQPVPAAPAAPAATAAPGTITSRKDVERYLDMIIAFYEKTEPSSPIPHLARRMRRLVPMNFLQLMEDVAPSGLKEFRNIAGVDDKSK